jgi:hypothetical protein
MLVLVNTINTSKCYGTGVQTLAFSNLGPVEDFKAFHGFLNYTPRTLSKPSNSRLSLEISQGPQQAFVTGHTGS